MEDGPPNEFFVWSGEMAGTREQRENVANAVAASTKLDSPSWSRMVEFIIAISLAM